MARLASQVVVLDNGHVVTAGTVEDVIGPGLSSTGLSRFAQSSVVTGRLAAVNTAYGLNEISHPAGTIWLTGRAGPIGCEARVVIRATDITLAKTPPQDPASKAPRCVRARLLEYWSGALVCAIAFTFTIEAVMKAILKNNPMQSRQTL